MYPVTGGRAAVVIVRPLRCHHPRNADDPVSTGAGGSRHRLCVLGRPLSRM